MSLIKDLSKEFDDLTKNLFEDKDSIYKSAVDANYVADKSLYGGPYHRLFDDSHSLGKMWGKIKDAKPDDSRIEEIIAWVKLNGNSDLSEEDIKEFYLGQQDAGIRGEKRWKKKKMWR